MEKANDRQVGGAHYKTEYEHWDLAVTIPLGYLEGCMTKYVARWRKKGGLTDLQKAIHYLDKLMEVANFDQRRNLTAPEIHAEVNRYALANNLTYLEEEFVAAICIYNSDIDLHHARSILEEIIEEAKLEYEKHDPPMVLGTPEDGGHHAV